MTDFKKMHRARSYIYNFLSILIRDEISRELFEKLRGEVFLQNLNHFVSRCPLADLKAAWRKLLSALEEAGPQDWGALRWEYAHIFYNAGVKTVFPYASCYLTRQPLVRGAVAEVRKFYRQARVHKSLAYDDLDDHLAVELEFMRYLSNTIAAAPDGAPEMVQLQNKFRRDHLMGWAPEFCAVLDKRATSGFYKALAEVILVTLFHDRALAMEQQASREEAFAMLAQALTALDLSQDLFTLAKGLIPGGGALGGPRPRKRQHP
ncbi:MAG: molecular chaperone TorD family protein [Deltaproteobacteria bacterium]|jgi:thiosulfate reductase/polysulfide reductase chain A